MNNTNNKIKISFDLRERSNNIVRFLSNNENNKIIKNLNTNTSLKILKESEFCSICLNEIKTTEIARVTNCKHTYHSNCLDRWLEEKSTCPLCKNNLLFSSS